MYKTELHCHSSEVSGCSSVDIRGVVEKYIEHGYTTVVLTNHIHSCCDAEEYARRVDRLIDTCEAARKVAGDRLCVLDGAEFRLSDGDDFLLVGVTRDFLLALEKGSQMDIGELRDFGAQHGVLTIQAHPLRYGHRLRHPEEVDGYEVHNGHPEQRSHNDAMATFTAELRAEGKILISGTDHHDGHHMPNSGIATDAPITDLRQLVDVLKSGNFSLIKHGKIVEE